MNEERLVEYDFGSDIGYAVFVPKCEKCNRYVKAGTVRANEIRGLSKEPNARCAHCGPTHMLFQGFY